MDKQMRVPSPVLGGKIKELRLKASDDARPTWAALNKISDGTLRKAEASDPSVTYRSLLKIAKALGVHVSEIYEDAPDDLGSTSAPPAWFIQHQEQIAARFADIEAKQVEILRLLRSKK